MLFRDEEVIGRDLVLGPWPDQPRRIVGVAEGVAQGGFTGPLAPAVYLPYGQVESSPLPHVYVMARGDSPPDSIAADLTDAIMGLDPGIAPSDLSPMESRIRRLGRPWAAATWGHHSDRPSGAGARPVGCLRGDLRIPGRAGRARRVCARRWAPVHSG